MRTPIAAAMMPARTSVIGKRSQTSVASFGSAWYQAEPIPVKTNPTATNAKLITVVGVKWILRGPRNTKTPKTPIATNTKLDRTLAANGTPNHARRSANKWYCGSWTIAGNSNAADISARNVASTMAPRRDVRDAVSVDLISTTSSRSIDYSDYIDRRTKVGA